MCREKWQRFLWGDFMLTVYSVELRVYTTQCKGDGLHYSVHKHFRVYSPCQHSTLYSEQCIIGFLPGILCDNNFIDSQNYNQIQ